MLCAELNDHGNLFYVIVKEDKSLGFLYLVGEVWFDTVHIKRLGIYIGPIQPAFTVPYDAFRAQPAWGARMADELRRLDALDGEAMDASNPPTASHQDPASADLL